jgi:phytoene dehydrogenase-like protein
MSRKPDIVVIGAGANGLTAATMLARNGRRVVVLERHDTVGGLAVGDELDEGRRAGGVLHDASIVSASVVEELELERHGLHETMQPPVFVPQLTGRGLLLHHDPHEAFDEIRQHSDNDARRYREYRTLIERLAPFAGALMNASPPDLLGNGLSGLMELATHGMSFRKLRRDGMHEALRVIPMSLADFLEDRFDTELLRAALAAPAIDGTFCGPRSPGTTANLIRREVLAESSVTVRGGPAALIDALAAAAEAAGVTIRTGAAVQSIRVEDGVTIGVTIDDGETIDARVVAASCDPIHTFTQLLKPSDISRRLEHRIECFRVRGTTAKVDLVLSEPLHFACRPDLAVSHARVGETLDDLEQAFDAIKYGRFSTAPTLDLRVDGAVVSIVVHFAPYDLEGGWNDTQRFKLTETVLDRLESYAPDLRAKIIESRTLTPLDIEQRYGVTQGHIHHGEHALDQLVVRPVPECLRYETPIEGLYLCGSGSHPGGGLTCRPGALAAAVMTS